MSDVDTRPRCGFQDRDARRRAARLKAAVLPDVYTIDAVEYLGRDSRVDDLRRIAGLLASDGPLRLFVPADPAWCLALPDAALDRLGSGAPLRQADERGLRALYRFALDRQIESLGGTADRVIDGGRDAR